MADPGTPAFIVPHPSSHSLPSGVQAIPDRNTHLDEQDDFDRSMSPDLMGRSVSPSALNDSSLLRHYADVLASSCNDLLDHTDQPGNFALQFGGIMRTMIQMSSSLCERKSLTLIGEQSRDILFSSCANYFSPYLRVYASTHYDSPSPSPSNPKENPIISRLDNIERTLFQVASKPSPPPISKPSSSPNPNPSSKPSDTPSYASKAKTPAKPTTVSPQPSTPSSPPKLAAKPQPGPVSYIARYQNFKVPEDERPSSQVLTHQVNHELSGRPSAHGLRVLSVRFIGSGNIRLDFPNNSSPELIEAHKEWILKPLPYPAQIRFSRICSISKIILSNVPTLISPTRPIASPDELLAALKENSFMTNFSLWHNPSWTRTPSLISGPTSSIVFAIEDIDGSKAQSLLRSQFFIFGNPTFPKAWRDKPVLRLCSRCLNLGHFVTTCRYSQPRCKHCGLSGHSFGDHARFCSRCDNKNLPLDVSPPPCPHNPRCFRCQQEHPADSPNCPVLASYSRPSTSRL